MLHPPPKLTLSEKYANWDKPTDEGIVGTRSRFLGPNIRTILLPATPAASHIQLDRSRVHTGFLWPKGIFTPISPLTSSALDSTTAALRVSTVVFLVSRLTKHRKNFLSFVDRLPSRGSARSTIARNVWVLRMSTRPLSEECVDCEVLDLRYWTDSYTQDPKEPSSRNWDHFLRGLFLRLLN
jgi:hypothetical protein